MNILIIILTVAALVAYAASFLPRFRADTTPPTLTPEKRLQAYERRRGRADTSDLLEREARGRAYKRWLLLQNQTYRHNRVRAGEPY